ncbi:hypothetical protein HELRODRAFT_161992 [Helobdella robusta]|uniref:Tubulin/FtsZ GTPase domain-containing protein n=1 Tax=Helobdella robusta TaxID=6412 RepID=T1ES46_HELRO|nr:hypothetical protein HELRODRAFT_161992 [Helobdella robusta]ESO02698.1 hypothetical protein HELRODRAFT_161992 [Helobdella robusta]
MSCVILQIGQCGNQVGQQFWSLVDNSLIRHGYSTDDADNCFTLTNPSNNQRYYRSINIDTENKVINSLFANNNKFLKFNFRPCNVITEKCGRGNNWAMGYYQGRLSHRDDIFERTMQEMRKEVERGETFKGCAIFHSVSGGTGSGVSSRLVELIRDEYAKECLISFAVTPFENGDTPLQDYNSLLALSKIHFHSDAVVLISMISNNKPASATTSTFNDLNKMIAECIAGLTFPINDYENNYLNEIMLEKIAKTFNTDYANKFVSCNSTSQQFKNWGDGVETLLNQLETFNKNENATQENFKLKQLLMIGRGNLQLNKEPLTKSFINKILTNYFQSRRSTMPISLLQSEGSSTSLTMAFQSNISKIYLEKIFKNSLEKFAVGAYVHWYERYEATVEDFHSAFKYIQNLLSYM